MTRGRKAAALGGVFLLAGLVAAGLALGAAYDNSPFKRGPEFFLERMDGKVKELNLNDSQKEKFAEIRVRIEKSMESGREEGRAFFEKLKTELNRDAPDMKAVAALIKTQMGRFQDRVGLGVDHFVEFYGILDAEQKEQVLAKAREHLGKPHRPGHPGPWGGKTE